MAAIQTVSESIAIYDVLTETLKLGYGTSEFKMTLQPTIGWTNGTGAGQIDLHWEKGGTGDVLTLASGASLTITLSALSDTILRTVAFVKVVKFQISVVTRAAGDYLTVGNAAVNPWTGGPWGSGTRKVFDFCMDCAGATDGFPVVSGSSDQVKILNSGTGAITFKVGVSGRSV